MTEISPKAYVAAAIHQVGRVPGIEPGMKGREIKKVAIIGAGLMGSGIAVCFLGAGIPTVLVDKDEGALARGRKYVDGALNTLLKRGFIFEGIRASPLGGFGAVTLTALAWTLVTTNRIRSSSASS